MFLLHLLIGILSTTSADWNPPTLALHRIASGLDQPVLMLELPSRPGKFLVGKLDGRIQLLEGETAGAHFLDIRDRTACCLNGGLLSVVFDPDFLENGAFYVLYVNRDENTVLSRFRADGDRTAGNAASEEQLLVIEQPADNVPNHHGGELVFGPAGYLYVSIGDGGSYQRITDRAQRLDLLLGKLLRIDVSENTGYRIPSDNPFMNASGARAEIWAYGLRNPWRFNIDQATGLLFLSDVGQDRWEEINILPLAASRGANFGWPLMEGRHCFQPVVNCDDGSLVKPQIEYENAGGDCSVTGGFLYSEGRSSALRGIYYFGDFCSGTVRGAWRGDTGEWEVAQLLETGLTIVSLAMDQRGEVYLIDYQGSIHRLVAPPSSRRRGARPLQESAR